MQPLSKVGIPEDIAKMVAFLMDNDQSGFVTGADYLVDGGAVVAGGLSAIPGNPISDIYTFVEK